MTIDKIRSTKDEIDEITKMLSSVLTNKEKSPCIELLRQLCIEEVIIAKNANGQTEIYDLQSLIKPRLEILTNGTLTEFEEIKFNETTVSSLQIVQRTSEYNKEGILGKIRFYKQELKCFNF